MKLIPICEAPPSSPATATTNPLPSYPPTKPSTNSCPTLIGIDGLIPRPARPDGCLVVRIVTETDKPIVARDLEINEKTLGDLVRRPLGRLSEDEPAERARLQLDNTELAIQRDVLINRARRITPIAVVEAAGRR